MPHQETYDRSWGYKQRTDEAAAKAIEAERIRKEQADINQFGTSSVYYGRSNRNPLTFNYYVRQQR